MGFTKWLRLKPSAVPSLHPVFKVNHESMMRDLNRMNRMQFRDHKILVAALINERTSKMPDPCESNLNEQACLLNIIDTTDREETGQLISRMEYDAIKEEMENFKRKNQLLKETLEKAQEEVQLLKDEAKSLQIILQKNEFERTNMENKLVEIFTSGQIKKLKNSSKRLQWTDADIAKSITLYSASPRAYKLLRNKKFPLPAIRTLQMWAQTIEISPSILDPVLLSFDEMKIRETYCYDKLPDTTYYPAKYCQVVMLRDNEFICQNNLFM